jgi:ParB family transcriptional regulator, chromosome partitioning protein
MPDIEIDKIIVNKRKRTSGDFENLVESIKDVGLINPITLNKDMVLIAGFHRLQACKQLGFKFIPANMIDADDLTAELAEIDENLIRLPLTALENAEQLQRRKEIYETLHPESKAEEQRKKGLNVSNEKISQLNKTKTFVEDTAEKTGKSPRCIQQNIQIASKISEEAKAEIKGTELENKKTALLQIAKQPAEMQKELVVDLLQNQGKEVKENELDIVYKVDFVRKKVVVNDKWLDVPPNYDMDDHSYNQMYWDTNNYTSEKQKES